MNSFYKGLHFSTFGDKTNPPLIFLHGFMGSTADWEEFIDVLKTDYYCIAIDLPGHGKSIEMEDTKVWTFNGLVKNLDELIGSLLLKKSVLIGYSMGGRIALYWALKSPGLFSSLVLESASPGIRDKKDKRLRIKSDRILAYKLKAGPLEIFLDSWYDAPVFAGIKNHRHFESLLNKRINNNPVILANSLMAFSQGKQPSLWHKLLAIKQKVLLIYGAKDTKYGDIVRSMKKNNLAFGLIKIKDCGHNTHFEKQDEFAEHLKQFLSLNIHTLSE